MSGERCPCCGGREPHPAIDAGIDVRVCPCCDFSWEAGTGAYFEPRDSLPTEADERAHAQTWGEGAGWMVRLAFDGEGFGLWKQRPPISMALAREDEGQGAKAESYPIAPDGRPVGWPTVKEE